MSSGRRADAEKVEAYTRALLEAARSEGRANSDLVQWQHAKKFTPEVLETLAAMQREDDLGLIEQVAKHYKELLDAQDTTVSVTVTTAVPMDDALRAKVRAKTEKDLHAPVYLVERVDPSIIGGIMLDDAGRTVTVDGEPVALTPTEFDILRLLMQHAGTVFSPREIYRRVWGDSPVGVENAVAVHIRHLRSKIEIDPTEPRYLKVVWGKGYKMEERRNEKTAR